MRSATFAWGFAGVLALVSLAPGLLPQAGATTFANLSIEQYVDASTFVVRGVVTEVWTAKEDGLIWTHARVRLSEVLKGPDRPKELVVSSLGGTHGEDELVVPGAAGFSVGEENLLFLTESGPRRHLVPVGKYNGKFILRRAPGEDRLYAMTFHPERAVAYDARFLPHMPALERMYVDEIVGRIEDRLDAGWDGKPIPGLSPARLQEINAPDRRSVR